MCMPRKYLTAKLQLGLSPPINSNRISRDGWPQSLSLRDQLTRIVHGRVILTISEAHYRYIGRMGHF